MEGIHLSRFAARLLQTKLNYRPVNRPSIGARTWNALSAIQQDIFTFYVTKRGSDGHGVKLDDEIPGVLEALRKELWKPGTGGKEREEEAAGK